MMMRDDPKQVQAPCCPAGTPRKPSKQTTPAGKRAKPAPDAPESKDGDDS